MIRRCFIALGLFFVAASARADGPALVQPGALTWGASVTFTPFEYIDNGKPSGFDVDLAELLAKKIGLTSNLVSMEFKGLIPALMGRRIDVIISGMYENAQRKEVADFVSYILVGNQIVVRKGNPLKITGKTDLCGHRVAAPVGTVFETSAKQISEACKAAGKAEISMLTLAGTSTCALALVQDRADAIIVSTPTLAGLQKESPDAYDAGGASFDNETQMGIAVLKDNPALTAALDKAMKELVADGSYAKLIAKWNLPAGASLF